MATRSARKRKQLQAMLDKPKGSAVVVKKPQCAKPYYDISLGHLAAAAEWRVEK
ncbi:hypothetical protein LSG31_00600 [Fodinisporobacter ferrooxydans]|uniref:Uncharacterized protein n=1 Tax=Fodinisporobacter ferrooxydans TaxID=2901836 RepID=A0ABY4CK86_9BACL|nr:hypothetical protein LSG31_00600 [Alicyclobacillaceae bacterium MYW30-H2]